MESHVNLKFGVLKNNQKIERSQKTSKDPENYAGIKQLLKGSLDVNYLPTISMHHVSIRLNQR